MQRVRIGTNHSSWLQLNGAMPQGSWLGPLTFLLLIDDQQVDCLDHKYVGDTTLTELLQVRNESSNMQNFFQQLLNWSNINVMAVNFTKTKEMVMGPVALSSNLPFIQWAEGQIERVSSFKLLGLHLDADFSWHSHVEAVTSKATKRVFLKQLKRAGVPHAQLLHFYLAMIRPVLEYAASVWHHSLNKSQKNQTEAIQERAIRIIFSCACDMPYTSALFVAGLEDLDNRRDLLSHNFFQIYFTIDILFTLSTSATSRS